METIGQVLKAARVKKGVNPSQAGAATRIKIQHIEEMERDDFSRMAAPAYAKGFIKLYAEYLGLDPAPLIHLYVASLKPDELRPPLAVEYKPVEEEARETALAAESSATAEPRRFFAPIRWSAVPWRHIGYVAGAVLLVVLLVMVLSRCERPEKRKATPSKQPPAEALKVGPLPVIQEPPEPYLEKTAPAGNTP